MRMLVAGGRSDAAAGAVGGDIGSANGSANAAADGEDGKVCPGGGIRLNCMVASYVCERMARRGNIHNLPRKASSTTRLVL